MKFDQKCEWTKSYDKKFDQAVVSIVSWFSQKEKEVLSDGINEWNRKKPADRL